MQVIERTLQMSYGQMKNYFTSSGSVQLDYSLLDGGHGILLYNGRTGTATLNDNGKSLLYPNNTALPFKLELYNHGSCNITTAGTTIITNINGSNVDTLTFNAASSASASDYKSSSKEITSNLITNTTKEDFSFSYSFSAPSSGLFSGTDIMTDSYAKLYFHLYSYTFTYNEPIKNIIGQATAYEGEIINFVAELRNNATWHGWYSDAAHTNLISSNRTYTVTASQDLTLYPYATMPSAYQSDLFFKDNNKWIQAEKIWKKVNGTWTQISKNNINRNDNYIYKNSKPIRLPTAYKEVEYLATSSAGPYIDTGIVPKNHCVELDFQFNNTQTTSFGASMCGCYNWSTGEICQLATLNSEGAFVMESNTTQEVIWTTTADTNRHTMVRNTAEHNCLYDGLVVCNSNNLINNGLTNNFYLFGHNGAITGCWKTGKIYYCKMTNNANNTILREYIPCYRVSDNTPGMYDLMNNQFYTNSGSGSFILGPEV